MGSGASDVAGGADFAPTAANLEALAVIEKDLTAVQTEYRNLIEKDIPTFNRSLAGLVSLRLPPLCQMRFSFPKITYSENFGEVQLE